LVEIFIKQVLDIISFSCIYFITKISFPNFLG